MKKNFEMAKEAGLRDSVNLERFAELVRADEREKVIGEFVEAGAVSLDGTIVAAIRARGNT